MKSKLLAFAIQSFFMAPIARTRKSASIQG